MNIDEIESLVQIVAKSAVSEISVRTPERRITVRRRPPQHASKQIARIKPARRDEAAPVPAGGESGSVVDSLLWVSAPLVGMFYHAEPPITVGITITPGQIVGVIESMKLMNEVRSDHGGIVVESAIEAGMAVEYGQPLFAVREPNQEAKEDELD